MSKTPFGESAEGAPKAPTMEEVFTDPAKYARTSFDPVTGVAPSRTVMDQFISDHSFGDGPHVFTPNHEPTGEDGTKVHQTPGTTGRAINMAEFYRGAPLSAILWWRIELGKPTNMGKDPGQAFMDAFLANLGPSQRAEMGLPANK